MARCDEGYLCDVCGQDVAIILDSDLYLRYILGEVPLDVLHLMPERHIRCNPVLAQYIVATKFPAVECVGPFAKANLDADYVQEEEARLTQAWRRLHAIPTLGLTIAEYPLSITPFSELESVPC